LFTGKFDPNKAETLGVPRGKMRGQLVRGEDVTLADGRVIKSSDVVGETQKGARFIVIDCPTPGALERADKSKLESERGADEAGGGRRHPRGCRQDR
jgi:ribonuclease Z